MSKEKVCNKNCPHYYNGQCFKEAKSYKDGYDDGIREERPKAYKIGYNDGYERGKAECVSAERVGEWTAEIGYEGEVLYYECSNCKEAFSLLEGTPEENKYNYCPNCGSRMIGGDTE